MKKETQLFRKGNRFFVFQSWKAQHQKQYVDRTLIIIVAGVFTFFFHPRVRNVEKLTYDVLNGSTNREMEDT